MGHQKGISENLFSSLDPLQVHLIGSRCRDCGGYSFPCQQSCSRCCGTAVEPVELRRNGILWTWTLQSFMPPSPPYKGPEETPETFKPFLLGMVELPGQCRVLGRILADGPEDVRIGMPMELTLFPYSKDEDGNSLISYALKPAST